MKVDSAGNPRAWATADTYVEALHRANEELRKYREEKRELGDPLAYETFTNRVEDIE